MLVFLPMLLAAQRVQDSKVPLKNWATPLYWHASQAERAAVAARTSPRGAAPQISFSATQVSPDALTFVAITPCRLVDTRGSVGGFTGVTPFNGPSLTSGMTQTYQVQSATEAMTTEPAPCGTIPSIAEAYSFNVTVIPQGGSAVDFITVWPTGGDRPIVSTLNDLTGGVVANAAIVPAGTAGSVNVFNSGPATTDLIIDMNGFYTAPTDLNLNTAIGAGSLANNTSGADNTATGAAALASNTSGSNNTATGQDALTSNTSGTENTATGTAALQTNISGGSNTAVGYQALFYNTASSNTAVGATSLYHTTTGIDNTAIGTGSLLSNDVGNGNSAFGYQALVGSTGDNNLAFGVNALEYNTTGNRNIAIGQYAGTGPAGVTPAPPATTNSDSIYIGSLGTPSDADGTIAIGTIATGVNGTITLGSAQTGGTFIAGIYGATPNTTNTPGVVCVDSTGALSNGANGTAPCSGIIFVVRSSIRYKEHVADMGDSSDKLLQLHPVTFLYKPQYDDGSHALQFGLIAEEVAKLYPEMVGYDKEGKPASINYQPLTPMLLNEAQKQHAEVQKLNELTQQQDETIRQLQDRLAALESLLSQAPTTTAPAVQ